MNIFKKTLLNLRNTKSKIRETFKKIKFSDSLTKEDIENIENCLLGADVGWKLTEKIISQIKLSKDKSSWEEILIDSMKSNLDKSEINNIVFSSVVPKLFKQFSSFSPTDLLTPPYNSFKQKLIDLIIRYF